MAKSRPKGITAEAEGEVAFEPLSSFLEFSPKPLVPCGPKKRVLVVGAGMAGLSAAYQLVNLGHEVTILEARDRPGGRVLTLREPFAAGLHAEAGAALLPNTHPHTMGYAAHFGLAVQVMPSAMGTAVFHLRGRHVTKVNEPRAAWPRALRLRREERSTGYRGMWKRYITDALPLVGNPRDPGWPKGPVARWDKLTLAQFLRARGASKGAIEILRLGYPGIWGDGIDVASALAFLRDQRVTPEGFPYPHPRSLHRASAPTPPPTRQNTFIPGGNDRLPRAFAESAELTGKIHYSTPVVRIEQDDSGIHALCAGPTPRRFSAERMICTIPFSVLRSVDLCLPLSPGKRRAIKQLRYTSVTRLWVQTTTAVWNTINLSGVALTDLPVMFVTAPSTHLGTTRGLLDVFVTGRHSRAMQALGPWGRLRATVDMLHTVFPGVADAFECGRSFCWDEEEWSRGDYPWFVPGDMKRLMPHISTPEGRLHIAGDHASMLPGWMQGAFESGSRAAIEVNEAPP